MLACAGLAPKSKMSTSSEPLAPAAAASSSVPDHGYLHDLVRSAHEIVRVFERKQDSLRKRLAQLKKKHSNDVKNLSDFSDEFRGAAAGLGRSCTQVRDSQNTMLHFDSEGTGHVWGLHGKGASDAVNTVSTLGKLLVIVTKHSNAVRDGVERINEAQTELKAITEKVNAARRTASSMEEENANAALGQSKRPRLGQ